MRSAHNPVLGSLLFALGAAMSMSVSASGGRDRHFGDDGKVFIGERAPIPGKPTYSSEMLRDVAITKAGRTIAVGDVVDFSKETPRQALVTARLPSGAPDESFNGNGYLFLSWLGHQMKLTSVAIQPDGSILVAGNTIAVDSAPIVCRLHDSGSLDMSFGTSGCRTLDTVHGSAAISLLKDIELLHDGRILVMGSPAGPPETARSAVVVKLRTDGTEDMEFGATDTCATPKPRCAIAVLPQAVAIRFEAVALTGDPETGEYVIAGSVFQEESGQQTALQAFRFDANGDLKWIGEPLDFSTMSGSNAYQVLFDAEISVAHGKTILAGMVSGADSTFAVIGQLDANGALDAQFGDPLEPGRIALTVVESSPNAISDIHIQRDGRIVAAIAAEVPPLQQCHVLRLDATGARDTAFGQDGIVSIPLREGESSCWIESITSDGRNIVMAGNERYEDLGSPDDAYLLRIHQDDVLIDSFDD